MIANSNRLWIAGTVLIGIALVALGWLLGISPKLTEASASDEQKVQVDSNNQQQTLKLAQLKKDFENLPAVKEELAELQAQIPSGSDYPAFLSEVNSLASDESITVTNVTFAAPTLLTAVASSAASTPAESTATPAPAATGTAAPSAASAATGAAAGSVVTIPTTLTLSGSFAHLQSTIGALQTGSRLLLVSGISASTSKGEGGGNTDTYSATVTGLLYVLTNSKTLIEDAPTSAATTAPTATDTSVPAAPSTPTGTSTP